MANIYLAGDWREQDLFDTVLVALRGEGHNVVDPRQHGSHESAELSLSTAGVAGSIPWDRDDRELIAGSDYLVLIVPSGKDAHADYGYAVAVGVTTIIYMVGPIKGKAVYVWADNLVIGLGPLLAELDVNLQPDQAEIEASP